MARVIITGGTGLIGKALSAELIRKNYEVLILTRNPQDVKHQQKNVIYAAWDVEKGVIDTAAFSSADYLVHLAGAGVADKRWTAKRKREIVESRVKSSELICKYLRDTPNKIKAVISASAIGWYGPDPSIPNPNPFREEDPPFDDFLGNTCLKWERSIDPVVDTGRRLVKLRTGIVLSKDGGALKEFKSPLKFGVATIIGTGKQVISWIHIEDLVRLYLHAIEHESLTGVYNAVAPAPASNKELVMKLAVEKKGKFFIPVYVPAFALKILLGEMSIEVLKSTTVSCAKLHVDGFTFLYPSLDAALREV